MEFTHNKDLIWSLLKTLGIANISEINFFCYKCYLKKKKKPIEQKSLFFQERSYGIFENFIQDKQLHQKK